MPVAKKAASRAIANGFVLPELKKFSIDQAAKIADCYTTNGYVVVSDLVQKDAVAAVKNEIEEVVRVEEARYLTRAKRSFDEALIALFQIAPDYRKRLYGVFQNVLGLHQLSAHEGLGELVKILGVKTPILRNCMVRVDIPGEDRFLQPLHQDVRTVHSENAVNFWLPVQDLTEKIGPMAIYPGSHTKGAILCDAVNESGYQVISEKAVQEFPRTLCLLKMGEVLAFNSFIAHQSSPNRSPNTRFTAVTRYDDGSEMGWLRTGIRPLTNFDLQETGEGEK